MVDMVQEAFDIADFYRNPVLVVGDGMIGQMMEPIEFNTPKKRELPSKDGWATTGTKGKRNPHIINSLFLDPQGLEDHNKKLQRKYAAMKKDEVRHEEYNMENAEIVITAYGTTSRIAKNAIDRLKEEGINVGLIRPQTLWPFPEQAFQTMPDTVKAVLTVEMSEGQMIEDVRLSLNGKLPTEFYGRSGGMIPAPDAIVAKVKEMIGGLK
jgi:2-oxoglutarate ferredoxin oxidoreductase subunit alpha